MSRARTVVLVALILSMTIAGFAPATAAETPSDQIVYQQNNSTTTPTPDNSTTANNTTSTSDSETNSTDETQISISVSPPRYIQEPVRERTSNNKTVYITQGEYAYLSIPFDEANVTKSGVTSNNARLVYDRAQSQWIIEPNQASTYRLFWEVQDANGQKTTYVAYIRFTAVDYTHKTPSEMAEITNKTAFAEYVLAEERFGSVCGDNPYQEGSMCRGIIEDAYVIYITLTDPLSALSGQLTQVITTLLILPAGWLLVGLWMMWRGFRERHKNRRLARYDSQFGRLADIDEAEREAYERLRKRLWSEKEFQDIGFSDMQAQRIREEWDVRDPWQAFQRITDNMSAGPIFQSFLALHGQRDEVAEVIRTKDGDIESVVITDDPDGDETFEPMELPEEYYPRIDFSTVDSRAIVEDDVDTEHIPIPVQELADQFEIRTQDDGYPYALYESLDDFASDIVALLTAVASSDYTDEDGYTRDELDLLNMLSNFVTRGAEETNIPVYAIRDVLFKARLDLSEDTQMKAELKKQEGRLPRHKDSTEVISDD